jgi:hypothetical protein
MGEHICTVMINQRQKGKIRKPDKIKLLYNYFKITVKLLKSANLINLIF